MADAPTPRHDPLVSPWGPAAEAGHRTRPWLKAVVVLGVVGLVAATAITTTGILLIQRAEASLTRVPVAQLDEVAPQDAGEPTTRHFLVVGSDARGGLSEEDRSELTLGSFDGQRADTILYVTMSADREDISLVSLPRDLLVRDDQGRPSKITDTFQGGPDALISVVQSNFGLPVHHYASISLGGFIDVVRTIGGVEICLDEPLQDRNSGAEFTAGCHQMGPTDALAFVRSRRGTRGDFNRIERQQQFIKAVVDELASARILMDPVRLFRIVDDVASNVETDEDLSIAEMRRLADEAREVVADGLPMATVPAYDQTINGRAFMVAYGPGARAMFDDLREGRPIADRGSAQERAETVVAVWSGGRGPETGIVNQTLLWAGFRSGGAGVAREQLDAGGTTVVYEVPGHAQQAAWVAATLGTTVEALPPEVSAPSDAQVVVAVGDDADS